jgi:hypothetical protein
MMLFVWLCVMVSSIIPGGDRLVAMQTSALEAEIQNQMDSMELVRSGRAIGAAENFVRPFVPSSFLAN